MQSVGQTEGSQFADSPVLTALIGSMNAAIDPAPLIADFYAKMFNVLTAQGYGLDCIGRIVGVSRVIQVAGGAEYFGFSVSGTINVSGYPFNQAPFYSGQITTSNYALTDDAFRLLIFAKMLANISNNSILAINNILMVLFGAGNGSGAPSQPAAYCTDNQGMAMTYTFSFTPTPVQLGIIYYGNVLPRPSGVALTVVHP